MFNLLPQVKYLLFYLVVMLLCALTSQAGAENLIKLPEKQGYLLLDVDVGGVAYLHYSKYLTSQQLGKDRVMDLNEDEIGFKLIPLFAGRYQITEIRAPFFNLPYKLNTIKQKKWQFTIEPGKINYIGKLTIARERTKDDVDIQLRNRIATDIDRIQSIYARELENYGLVVGSGYQDSFLQEYQGGSTNE